MSSFFTTPASQRKRKRNEKGTAVSVQRRNTGAERKQNGERTKARRDESISGSESGTDDERRTKATEEISESESDYANETAADRRRRLAEQYLENTRKETLDAIGFDAEELDKDLIAERLKEDVAEDKGKLYRHIASTLDFGAATQSRFRADALVTTAIAACPPYVYTASKDLTLIKWELALPSNSSGSGPVNGATPPSESPQKPRPLSRRPKQLVYTKGNRNNSSSDLSSTHHTAPILAIVASPTGNFLATGGADRKIIVWSTATLTPLRQFTHHRDAITSLSFRGTLNQLFSGSKDRTVKVWNIDETGGSYIETLHGHEDQVVDVAGIGGKEERCISVGARDRTARLWKVVEEQQLVFRGGGGGGRGRVDRNLQPLGSSGKAAIRQGQEPISYAEGSIDRVCFIDSTLFVTGSDNGSLSLWSIHKKKPVFTLPLAHGVDPSPANEDVSPEQDPDNDPSTKHRAPQPRWITALKSVVFSDLFVSGSWDGWVRAWRVSEDKRKIEALGTVGRVNEDMHQRKQLNRPGGAHLEGHVDGYSESIPAMKINANGVLESLQTNGIHTNRTPSADSDKSLSPAEPVLIRGIINDLDIFEQGERGRDGVCIVVAVGSEHRLGRWQKMKGKNGAVVFEVPKKRLVPNGTAMRENDEVAADGINGLFGNA